MAVEIDMGVNVHELFAANLFGPLYSEEYLSASPNRKRELEKRQEFGETLYGIQLENTLLRINRGTFKLKLWTDRDIPRKLRLMRKAVNQTPPNEFLTSW